MVFACLCTPCKRKRNICIIIASKSKRQIQLADTLRESLKGELSLLVIVGKANALRDNLCKFGVFFWQIKILSF